MWIRLWIVSIICLVLHKSKGDNYDNNLAQQLHRVNEFRLESLWLLGQRSVILESHGYNLIHASLGTPTHNIHDIFANSINEYFKKTMVSNYGQSGGQADYFQLLSQAWIKDSSLKHNLIFSFGATQALDITFQALNRNNPHPSMIVTTDPHYPLHWKSTNYENSLITIPLCDKHHGCKKLTAELLNQTLESYKTLPITAILLCDPHNPLGFYFTNKEMDEILDVIQLNNWSHIYLIVDMAYDCFKTTDAPYNGWIHVMKRRHMLHQLIEIHSASKCFSLSGERIAITFVGDNAFKSKMIHYLQPTVHLSQAFQYAYTQLLSHSEICQDNARQVQQYYQPKVEYIESMLNSLNLSFPSNKDKIQSVGMYALVKLSRCFGKPSITWKMTYFYPYYPSTFQSDMQLADFFMIEFGISLAPLSTFYGGSPEYENVKQWLILRITCTAPIQELDIIISRLKQFLRHYC